MKRLIDCIRSLYAPFAIGLLLVMAAFRADAQLYCNNPVSPCNPDDPQSVCYRPASPSPRCEPKECGKCTKSPCYVGSGVYSTEATDLEIRTLGFPISVSRLYESSRAVDGEMGVGWVTGLSARIYLTVVLKDTLAEGDNEAYVRLPSGTLYRFVEDAFGNYVPPPGRFDRLIHNADGTWEFRLQRTRSVYRYAATGELTGMTDDSGNSLVWSYEKGLLSRIAFNPGDDPKSLGLRYVELTWGSDGRLSDVTDHTGRNVHYDYDSAGRLAGVTNPLGQTTRYEYAAGRSGPLLRAINDHWNRNVTTVTYDANDRVKTYTDRGETYTYTYAYQGQSRVTAKSDSSGNTWVYTFTPEGLVTDIQPPGGGTGEHVDYDANGLIVQRIDARGVRTRYTYDERGQPLTVTFDDQGPAVVEWRYAYDPNFPDNVLSVTPWDPVANQIHRHWQARKFDYYPPGSPSPGMLHRVYDVEDDGATSHVRTTYTYTADGRIETVTDAGGNVTSYAYVDDVTTVERPANNDAGIRPRETYATDTLGRLRAETDALGRTTSYTWDALDRLTSRTAPAPFAGSTLQFVTTFRYDDFDAIEQLLFTVIQDPNGRIRRIGLDQYDNEVVIVDALGKVTRNTHATGLHTATRDANDNVTLFHYDTRRRLDSVTHPDLTVDRYTYHEDGTMATRRDRTNRVVSFEYDGHKRLRVRQYPAGAVTYTYEGQKLMSVVDARDGVPETHTYTWDTLFRVHSETQGSRGTVTWTYAPDRDHVETMAVTGRSTTTYQYYPDGSIRALSWSPMAAPIRFEHLPNGLTSAVMFPGGLTRSYSYDGQDRLTNVSNVHSVAGMLAAFQYGYDLDAFTGAPAQLGMRTTQSVTQPSLGLVDALLRFGYDGGERLVRAVYPQAAPYEGGDEMWQYDAIGNRTVAIENGASVAYSYYKSAGNPLNGQRLQSDGSNVYQYDARGNTISRQGSRGTYSFGWDDDNHLISVTGDEQAAYRYDAADRLVAVTNASFTTQHIYDGVHAVADSGATPAEYLFAPGIDRPLAMHTGGVVYYYVLDGLNSVVALCDSSGVVHNTYAWDAWGGLLQATETVPNSLGYTARPTAAAGLQDNRRRYYEPATGTFRSIDPLIGMAVEAMGAGQSGITGGLREYLYASNNPVMITDPLGLFDCKQGCRDRYSQTLAACVRTKNNALDVCLSSFVACLRTRPIFVNCARLLLLCEARLYFKYRTCIKNAGRDVKACLEVCCDAEPRPRGGGGAGPMIDPLG